MNKIFLLLSVFMVSACAEIELASHVAKQMPITDNKQDKGYFKVGSSYRIAGKRYTPRETYNHSETGKASWYGPNFHGKMTANGETFDKFEMTAAHRTLQMPSIIRVTNLANGRNAVLRVNDRGPFSKGRILDVSERAAEVLGFKQNGTTQVRVEVIGDASRQVANLAKQGHGTQGFEVALNKPTPVIQPQTKPIALTAQTPHLPSPKPVKVASLLDPGIYVQAGSFGQRGSADALARQLQTLGQVNVSPANVNGSQFYRVRFGPFESVPEANQVVAGLETKNISAPIIIVE
ncbi:MAG: septal ring lytic transglycosylase RlpA family protein [Alphaproteobacteria bacterium]